MNRAETARLLAKVRAYDNRDVGEATVYAWHEALSDVDFADACEAVRRHYRVSREWLMPVDVLDHADTIGEERAKRERDERAERMRAETLAIQGPPPERVTSDRSAELIAQLRRTLRPGDPAALRGPAWRARNPGLRPSTRDGA